MLRGVKAAKQSFEALQKELKNLENMEKPKDPASRKQMKEHIKDAKNNVKTAKGLYHFEWTKVQNTGKK